MSEERKTNTRGESGRRDKNYFPRNAARKRSERGGKEKKGSGRKRTKAGAASPWIGFASFPICSRDYGVLLTDCRLARTTDSRLVLACLWPLARPRALQASLRVRGRAVSVPGAPSNKTRLFLCSLLCLGAFPIRRMVRPSFECRAWQVFFLPLSFSLFLFCACATWQGLQKLRAAELTNNKD